MFKHHHALAACFRAGQLFGPVTGEVTDGNEILDGRFDAGMFAEERLVLLLVQDGERLRPKEKQAAKGMTA
jgi:hypothetical protein